jgi:predicted nucleic acid-binding protein
MALVIADTGPIIALAQINQLDILRSLFGEVVLPGSVWAESQAKQTDDSERIRLAKEDGWIIVREVTPKQDFSRSLHDGEIEALQLALDEPESLLVVDDQLARRAAIGLQLDFIGTVKVLQLAEQQNLIASAADSIKAMQKFGYRVSVKFLS